MIVLYVIVALLLLVFITALFVKKNYAVTRHITIRKPLVEVFRYIRLLRNQDNFSKWASMDPAMKKEYAGIDGTEGFVSAWESENKKVGQGEQTIKKIRENEQIDYELHFIKPFEGRANAWMKTSRESEIATKVEWGMSSAMKYPMNLMLLFMDMEKMIGDDFETGLRRLKEILEDPSN